MSIINNRHFYKFEPTGCTPGKAASMTEIFELTGALNDVRVSSKNFWSVQNLSIANNSSSNAHLRTALFAYQVEHEFRAL
jgi:hypothetical protein